LENDGSKSYTKNARRYLKNVGGKFFFNPIQGIYQSKSEVGKNQRSKEAPGSQREVPLHVNVRRDRIAIAISALTLLLLAGTIFYTRQQWRTMNDTYDEIQKQTKAALWSEYMACLSTRTAQLTFLLIQKSALDSHAATAATIEQAIAGIESERALLSFIPRIPTPNELSNDKFGIPYTIRNDGKSPVTSLDFRAKAVWLSGADSFPLGEKLTPALTAKYIPAGAEIPDKPTDPRFHSMTFTLPVSDVKGNEIPASSNIVGNFIAGEPGMVAVLAIMKYSDFSGSHEVKFCSSMYVVKSGATHHQDQNEKLCAKYNQRDDRYTGLPSLPSVNSDAEQIKPIPCVKPKD
jgi:hypothetical protein